MGECATLDEKCPGKLISQLYQLLLYGKLLSVIIKYGYEGDGIQICAVSDECLLGEHLCHENAICTDLDDQYKCDCLPGFKGKAPTKSLKI